MHAPDRWSMRRCKKWKLGQFTEDAQKIVVGACRDKIVKTTAQNEIQLAREQKAFINISAERGR